MFSMFKAAFLATSLYALAVESSGTPRQKAAPLRVTIDVTTIPPIGIGGDDTTLIAGIVRMAQPDKYKIVVYAHTNVWYVQPTYDEPLTDIGTDGSWNVTTHMGARYAVLVVQADYKPSSNPVSIPSVGGKVLAQTFVPHPSRKEGKR